MRERDGLDYLLVAVVAVLAAVHIPPYAVAKRETVRIARETGIDFVVDVRVAVVLLAALGLVILLVVTDTVPGLE